jgi:hypothetical protein
MQDQSNEGSAVAMPFGLGLLRFAEVVERLRRWAENPRLAKLSCCQEAAVLWLNDLRDQPGAMSLALAEAGAADWLLPVLVDRATRQVNADRGGR